MTTDIAEGLPLVWGQQLLLEQVMMNLLLNARDAMRETPFAQRQVRVEAAVTADEVEIRVLDNGPGIPDSILERLFEPFFTTKPVGQGTGLGLSICFGIMQSCGGSITAANRQEGGAVFTLRLKPVALQAFEEAAEHQGSN
jgi:C4-dicarboxylate-specific signal transduction histidine kinase